MTTTDVSLVLLLGPQLQAFRAAGYDVTTASAPGPYADELMAQGFAHLPLRHATRAMAPHRDVAALAELWSLFRNVRPDVVHTHNPKPGVYGRIAARMAGVPAVVHTTHGLYAVPEDSAAKRAVVYRLERLASRCSHAELVQNPEDLETLAAIGVPRSKLTLLGNGVDLGRFDPNLVSAARRDDLRRELGFGPDDAVIGTVGRLVWEKGYRQLFDAFEALTRSHPNARLVVIGPFDPGKADALSDADRRGAEALGVRFLGERRDMTELYAAMDVFALTSRREGFPRAAMEAAAMGRPIVATNIRGCRQVVEPGRTGVLVPLDDVPALVRALAALVDDPVRRQAMGAAARVKAAREFDDRQVIETTLAVYARLVDQSSTRAAA